MSLESDDLLKANKEKWPENIRLWAMFLRVSLANLKLSF